MRTGCSPKTVTNPTSCFFDLPGHVEKRRGKSRTLSQMGLHLHARQCRPASWWRARLQFVMMFNDNLVTTGLCQDKGYLPVLDNGGRTGEDGTVRPLWQAVRRKQFSMSLTRGCPTASVSAANRPTTTQVGVPLDHPSAGHRHAAWKPYPGVVGRNMFHHQRISVMASRKLNTEGIDESLLLASIGKSRQMGDTLAREEAGNAESAIKPSVADPSENAARTVETKTKPRTRQEEKDGLRFHLPQNGAS